MAISKLQFQAPAMPAGLSVESAPAIFVASFNISNMSTPSFNNLKLELQDQILTLTINRPTKLNALNIETVRELKEAMEYVKVADEVRAVIVTGEGPKSFVAGADISEIAQLSASEARKFAENGQAVFQLFEDSLKPVIAAVNGFALGGGCELAMSCHIRVASDNARFGQPEVNLGIIPGYGGTQRLTQLIGKGKALELMMTADAIKAEEALPLGLVNYVVPQEELMNKCRELLQKIMSKSPVAIGQVIVSTNAFFQHDQNGYAAEAKAFGECANSDDFKEGTQAFLEKRTANFQGK
jgi:enoyl-CoA hydratase